MQIYPYKCEACGELVELLQAVQGKHLEAECKCGGVAKRVWTTFGIDVDFKDGYDEGAGAYFSTKRDRENFLSKNGLRKAKAYG
jgi:putative FmdB family regulatory protein